MELKNKGFVIKDMKSVDNYELTITADAITSTDERFDVNNLRLGNYYESTDAYYVPVDGDIIRRNRNKSENRISNLTLPRLACQVFEDEIARLSPRDKVEFPICKYSEQDEVIRGIFEDFQEYKRVTDRKSYGVSIYSRPNGPTFVFYSWNVFSTLIFVQECLRRFGKSGDKFILKYRDKDNQNFTDEEEIAENSSGSSEKKTYNNIYSEDVIKSKNVIFRGAPGTGKSYLAKQIAADIISDGLHQNYNDLSDEQKSRIEFVQFHPSYDYTDFVEGLRPKMNDDGSMGFELKDGVFKKFVERARKNYENSKKSQEEKQQEANALVAVSEFLSSIEFDVDKFSTVSGNEFYIVDTDEKHIELSIPNNPTVKRLRISIDEIIKMLESDEVFEKVTDITKFFNKQYATQAYSYDFALYTEIIKRQSSVIKVKANPEKLEKYVFIIDEINRGEMSKIFGELFFSIDPGYRGVAGEISTQYANMHSDPTEKFYIPENVYIIGTMNDIDRSVDSFDFAIRRRFRFIEITAEDSQVMLGSIKDPELAEEAILRMNTLNDAIVEIDDLNENYQIGAAYFLRLNTMSFDELWTDCIEPLLKDYIRGMYDEKTIMAQLAEAYGYPSEAVGDEENNR